MILSPNDIAAAIYWCGTEFGPTISPPRTQGPHGTMTPHIPKPGSPERRKLENWLDVAIAIALAESGGDSDAKSDRSTASGLWQIMVSVHGPEINDAQIYWASQRANGKTPTIFDPLVNTFVAGRLYQQSGWKPWVTYMDGDYKKHLGHGKAAYAFLTSPANLRKEEKMFKDNMKTDKAFTHLVQDFTHGLNPFDVAGHDWSGFMNGIFDFLRKGALAVGVFVLGVIIMAIGVWSFMSKTKAGKSIKKTAKTAGKLAIVA